MNGLLRTLVKPDWDDNPKRSEILHAANLLHIGEFQLVQLAYKSWYNENLPEDRINKIFSEDTFFCGENLSSIFENFSGFKYADRSYRKPEHILKLIRRIDSENELEKYSDLNPIYSRSPNITKKKER